MENYHERWPGMELEVVMSYLFRHSFLQIMVIIWNEVVVAYLKVTAGTLKFAYRDTSKDLEDKDGLALF